MMHRLGWAAAAFLATALPLWAEPADAPDAPQYPDRLDGTLSALGDLEDDNAPRVSHLRFPTMLDGWMAEKARFREQTGISFSGSLGLLYQNYSDPLTGVPDAAGYKLTFNLSKDLLNAGSPDALSLDIAIEARGPVGTPQPPLQGGVLAGNIVPTAATWGDFNYGITQLYIRQSLYGNRFQYAVGRLFAPNFVNAYPFFDDNRQFLNQNFSTSPTIASALRGFGAIGLIYPTDGGLYVQAGIFTANSQDTGNTIDSFFNEDEYFTTVEIGWSGLARLPVPIAARGPMDQNNVHLTLWHKDAQPNAPALNQPEAQGVAFNANFMYGPNTMWFVRGGASDGWITQGALSAGIGYRPPSASADLFGIAGGWTDPANENLRDQFTFETFYRYQLTPNLAITPDLQVVFNPSLNPTIDSQLILGLRLRATF
jgi:hypothetical protein